METVSDPVWIVSSDFATTRFNPAFAALRAKGFDPLTPWWRDLARRVLDGRAVSADTRFVIDGVERVFAVTGTPAGHDGAVFLLRDITDTSRGEREGNLELAITRMFEPEKPLEESLQDVLALTCESDGWDCAVIWLVDATNTQLEPHALWSRAGSMRRSSASARQLRLRADAESRPRVDVRRRRLVPDLLDESASCAATGGAGLHARGRAVARRGPRGRGHGSLARAASDGSSDAAPHSRRRRPRPPDRPRSTAAAHRAQRVGVVADVRRSTAGVHRVSTARPRLNRAARDLPAAVPSATSSAARSA
jgi:hypothetical protein